MLLARPRVRALPLPPRLALRLPSPRLQEHEARDHGGQPRVLPMQTHPKDLALALQRARGLSLPIVEPLLYVRARMRVFGCAYK